jgi:hypothetical protein
MADAPCIEDLLAEGRHHRHRYDLYRATRRGPSPRPSRSQTARSDPPAATRPDWAAARTTGRDRTPRSSAPSRHPLNHAGRHPRAYATASMQSRRGAGSGVTLGSGRGLLARDRSSEESETTPFVREQQSRAALPLLVRSRRAPERYSGTRTRGESGPLAPCLPRRAGPRHLRREDPCGNEGRACPALTWRVFGHRGAAPPVRRGHARDRRRGGSQRAAAGGCCRSS